MYNYNLWNYSYTHHVKSVYNSFDFNVTAENLTSDNGMPLSNKKEIKEKLNHLYDEFLQQSENTILDQFFGFHPHATSFQYRVEYKSTVLSNVETFNEKNVYTHDIYYVYKIGRAHV